MGAHTAPHFLRALQLTWVPCGSPRIMLGSVLLPWVQVENVMLGAPYLVYGSGTECACKPISEADLASYIADAVQGERARRMDILTFPRQITDMIPPSATS